MEIALDALSIIGYIGSCVFFYIIAMFLSKSMDEKITLKNILICLFWPVTMWFLK